MKYFSNIKNADELRKAYRAICLTMHPDRGGNEEEFKAMQAEFETLKKQYQNGTAYTYTGHTETAEERRQREEEERREREEWARWEAEEKARREEEERKEAERKAKQAEEMRRKVKEWANRLERLPQVERTYYGWIKDKKNAAAVLAATKRNIKAVINHYFPGMKVKVKISGEAYKETFEIHWEDGPTVAQVEAIEELYYFIPSVYHCADVGEDYGHWSDNTATEEWRKAYGEAAGDSHDFAAVRTLSEEGQKQADEFAARFFKNWNTEAKRGDKLATTWEEFYNFMVATGQRDQACRLWGNYTNDYYLNDQEHGDIYYSVIRDEVKDCAPVNVDEKAKADKKAAEFAPKYGPTYRAIKKALGANIFFEDKGDSRDNKELNIFEAAEKLAKGEAVKIGHISMWDNEPHIYGTDNGGRKVQEKRAAKFEAVGVILAPVTWHNYSTIEAVSIKAETLEALRREFADIERQRKEWEQEQTAKASENRTSSESNAESISSAAESRERKATAKANNEPTAAETDNSTPTTEQANSENVAEGLQLVAIPGGVAVVGTGDTEKARSRQTYRARHEIKARGAKWNKPAARWEATDPDTVAALREWLGDIVSETAPAVAPALEQGGEITAAERLGEAVREWSANEYAATHHGATLTEWDKQHPAPVEWCKPGQVFKLGREIAGREVYAIVTKLGVDCFFYVGNFGNNNEHLSAYNCQRWENLQPVEVLHEDTPKFAKMFQKFHDIRKAWEADGVKIWQEREDKERAAAVVLPTLKQAEEISEPAAIAASDEEGAPVIDTAAAFAPDIVAQAREAHPEWPAEFFTADFFEREATDEHGHRIKRHSEIKEQACRLECNYFAGRGGYRDTARRLERTKGAQHPDTLKAYVRLQQRARLLRAAELEAYRQAGEARRAAYYRTAEISPAADIVAASLGVVCHSYEAGAPVIESREITAPADLAAIIETAKQQESRTQWDMVETLIRIEFEHDGRMTPDEAREYVRGRVIGYADHTHTIDEGTRICDVQDMGEPEPEPRPTFAEVARDEVESRYNNGDTTFTAAVAIAEAISKAVAATHGKGNAARYMLDTIAYYVQSHCNTVLNDDEEAA